MPLPDHDGTIDRLISEHRERARAFALRIATRNRGIDNDEAIANAYCALVEAAHSYRDRGHKFWSYARYSIEGAVRDSVQRDYVRAVPPIAVDHHVERRYWIAELLAGMERRSRQVLIDYYWRGRTQSEIADSLRLSEMRVGQLRDDALNDLRARLRIRVRNKAISPG